MSLVWKNSLPWESHQTASPFVHPVEPLNTQIPPVLPPLPALICVFPSSQPAYVLQIFPPCEFSESHLSRLAPDLLASISNISPHLMIVIASV